jgi:hypothetical protein
MACDDVNVPTKPIAIIIAGRNEQKAAAAVHTGEKEKERK